MKTHTTYVAAIFVALTLMVSLAASPAIVRAADAVTDANVGEKLETATTAADHDALAGYFREKATEAGKTVAFHESMLASLKNARGRTLQLMEPHCGKLIEAARKSQEAYESLANDQAALAGAVEK